MRTEAVGGLFVYDLVEREERRIFHKEELALEDLAHHPERAQVACSVAQVEGQSIALCSTERFDLDLVTEGDSVDACPSWVPGQSNALVYQSAGIGRNQAGLPVGLGPAAIEKVDLKNGTQETLLSDPLWDYLSPRLDEEGNLYCIRRPYELGHKRSHWESLKDFALIPYRILKALYGFFNLMSQIFGKESLVTERPGVREDQMKAVYLKGRLLDLRKVDKGASDASVVPADWQLIRVSPAGEQTVLADRVSEYDLGEDGEVLFTSGWAVYKWTSAKTSRLYKGSDLIEGLLPLGGST